MDIGAAALDAELIEHLVSCHSGDHAADGNEWHVHFILPSELMFGDRSCSGHEPFEETAVIGWTEAALTAAGGSAISQAAIPDHMPSPGRQSLDRQSTNCRMIHLRFCQQQGRSGFLQSFLQCSGERSLLAVALC